MQSKGSFYSEFDERLALLLHRERVCVWSVHRHTRGCTMNTSLVCVFTEPVITERENGVVIDEEREVGR